MGMAAALMRLWQGSGRVHAKQAIRARDRDTPANPGECCGRGPMGLALAGSRDGLLLSSRSCEGDESRVCCPFPVVGQKVVATGTLRFYYYGWVLLNERVCLAPARD